MPHGGRRPGAGAPRGNMNAVKSGRYSKRLRTLAKALAGVPEVAAILAEFERRQRVQRRKAIRIAHRVLVDFLAGNAEANNTLLAYLRPLPGNGKDREETNG